MSFYLGDELIERVVEGPELDAISDRCHEAGALEEALKRQDEVLSRLCMHFRRLLSIDPKNRFLCGLVYAYALEAANVDAIDSDELMLMEGLINEISH